MPRLSSAIRTPAWAALALVMAACSGGGGAPSAGPELLAPAAAGADSTSTTSASTSTTAPAATTTTTDPRDNPLCIATAAVAPAGDQLVAAAEQAAAGLTSTDPAGFLAEFRAAADSDLPQLGRAAAGLEYAWRAVTAELRGAARSDAELVAGWLASLAASAHRPAWPHDLAGPWEAGAGEAAPAAAATAGFVAGECGVELPIPPGLPGGDPVPLLEVLAGPPGFVAPPRDVTTAAYDVEQSSLPHATFVVQKTEFEAPDRVRAEVEWTVDTGRHAVEDVVVVGSQVHRRWSGQGWRDARFEEDLSLAPFRADRTVPFGAILDALCAGANSVPPQTLDVRGDPAHYYELVVDEALEEAVLGHLAPVEGRAEMQVTRAELWVEPASGLPRKASVALNTPVYTEGLVLTWEFRSFGDLADPIELPATEDGAPAGFTMFSDPLGGWQAPISVFWIPIGPAEAGLTKFVAPTASVEVFRDDAALEGALDTYEQLLIGAYGEPLERHRTTLQLGSLPAERTDLIMDGPAGPELWTLVHASDGERAYWIIVIAFEPDLYLYDDLDELFAGFELLGTTT